MYELRNVIVSEARCKGAVAKSTVLLKRPEVILSQDLRTDFQNQHGRTDNTLRDNRAPGVIHVIQSSVLYCIMLLLHNST